MENTLFLAKAKAKTGVSTRFGLDTTFVLFFLAMDIGAEASPAAVDGGLAVLTLVAFIVLPYFLPFFDDLPAFWPWVAGRALIALVAILAGSTIANAAGTLLPVGIRYLPMTMLIFSGIFCVGGWLYGMMKVRLAV